jgi:RNA polymerase sigma-70 factor (ECF subfamily)
MNGKNAREEFVARLTGCQSALYAHILALVPDVDTAQDILQETNVVIWRKLEDGIEVQNFIAWAREIARFKVLAYLRDQGRDRHVFDAELVERIADKDDTALQDSSWMAYLEECLELRSEEERQLLKERYEPGVSVKDVAERHGLNVGSLSVMLSRSRSKLAGCVQRKLAAERHS